MEKQIKSKQRVKEFAEVFTAEREVKAICDLIPDDVWNNIESTFLDPAVGNGNFPYEILARKYARCKSEKDGLKALASVFAIDIQEDNVLECRARLLKQYVDTFPKANELAVLMASGILLNNIVCDDSLNPQTEIVKSWGFTPCNAYIKALEKVKKNAQKYLTNNLL